MNETLKSKALAKEISTFKMSEYRSAAEKLSNMIPDYFYHVAASSTGKYHPSFSLGEGGLVRHTKTAFKFARVLLDNPCFGDKYTLREQELMCLAILFHDSFKHGLSEEKYTKADHPLLAANFILEHREEIGLNLEDATFVSECIKSHMGPWNTDYYTKEEILPKPHTKYQNFVHMCDYLSSKKFLDVKFEHNEIVE